MYKKYFLIGSLITITALQARPPWRTYGDTFQVVIPLSALATATLKEDGEGCWQLIKSFTASLVATSILRAIIYERRPKGNGKHSFPSQHTSASFSGAAFYGTRYGWGYGTPAYIAASAVGYSRIKAKAHHWVDVLGGAAISIGFNYLFVTPYQDVSNAKKLSNK